MDSPPLTTDTAIDDLVMPDGLGEALAHDDTGIRISLVWSSGELQEIGPPKPPDADRIWAEVDLPALLTRDEAFRFQR